MNPELSMSITGYFHGQRKNILLALLCVAIFLVLRLPGIDVPYYQDEWKNVSASSDITAAGDFFAHPPLMQMIFVAAHSLLGADYFRLLPLVFSLATLFLLYHVVAARITTRAAAWACFLFIVCFYSILGSLMPDVDGSIMPFFLLASIYCYDRFIGTSDTVRWKWFIFLTITLLLGFLTKLSFVLVVGVFFVDYLIEYRRELNLIKVATITGAGILFCIVYVGLLLLIRVIYPAFDLGIMFGHANQFAEQAGRNWIQIAVQGFKAMLYLSPLLFAPLLFISRETLKKTRIFWLYSILGFIFYFIIFDFSRGVLDKYLMFLIVPLVVIVGSIFSEVFVGTSLWKIRSWGPIVGVVLAVAIFLLSFLPHEVLALYPKTLWFSRVLHGQWLMLNPFTGGSGPIGFYVSFLFMAVSFVVSGILVIAGFMRKEWRITVLLAVVVIGFVYNVVMAEELFYGRLNGSAAEVLQESIAFLDHNSSIREVVTYNDTGARELSERKLYAGRFYAAPQFEEIHRTKFATYRGHYMIIGIPPLYDGFYRDFFKKCDILFETRSGMIAGHVYECE